MHSKERTKAGKKVFLDLVWPQAPLDEPLFGVGMRSSSQAQHTPPETARLAARLVCESISVASYTPQGVYDQHNSRAASAARSHLGQCLMQISVAADTAVVTTVKAQHTLSKL